MKTVLCSKQTMGSDSGLHSRNLQENVLALVPNKLSVAAKLPETWRSASHVMRRMAGNVATDFC